MDWMEHIHHMFLLRSWNIRSGECFLTVMFFLQSYFRTYPNQFIGHFAYKRFAVNKSMNKITEVMQIV